MGKVRPEHVKKVARELIESHPDRFSTDFQSNKEVLDSLAQLPSTKLRNRIAGYITSLLSSASTEETEEEDEAAEEADEEKE